jgi:hydrogenase expression/formation protein HypC
MCLAIPARVVELHGPTQALIELDGVRRLISRELIDEVAVGDYVIVHVGYALSRLDEAEALRTLELLERGSPPQGAPAPELGAPS